MKKRPGLLHKPPEISAKAAFSLSLNSGRHTLWTMSLPVNCLKNHAFSVLAALSIGLFAACTHLKNGSLSGSRSVPCSHMDWYEIGRLDGLSGTPLRKLEEHKHQCPDGPEAVHEEMYTNGRNAGLVEYCSAQGGLEAGRNGDQYMSVCPAHLEPVFLANYQLGQKIRELEMENEDLDARIRNLSRLISPTSPSTSIRGQIEQLRNRRTQNTLQIIDLEMQAGETGQL